MNMNLVSLSRSNPIDRKLAEYFTKHCSNKDRIVRQCQLKIFNIVNPWNFRYLLRNVQLFLKTLPSCHKSICIELIFLLGIDKKILGSSRLSTHLFRSILWQPDFPVVSLDDKIQKSYPKQNIQCTTAFDLVARNI